MPEGGRRLAAIMFTDMVGYTALGQRNETLSLALVDEQRKLIRPVLRRHNGREIKTIGDAFLVEFPSALEAVRCAYDIQRATAEFNISLPEDRRVHLRVGIHLGDIVESQGDISGDAVNVASRIQPLAETGGVCLSRQVYDHVQNKFELPFASLGFKNFKNVNTPIEVYKMVMPWGQTALSQSPDLDKKRIAVLPLANLSPDPNDEYFADGLTEELISAISNVSGVSVISRTSVIQYKKPTQRLGKIGEELKVGSILEGSVRKAGNKIRVAVQLIDVKEDKHLWAQNFERELQDVFAVQADIAEKVANTLKVKVLGEERDRLEKRASKNPRAVSLYTKGLSTYLGGGEGGSRERKAIEYFDGATLDDPDFALAYVGLADCYYDLAGEYISRDEGRKKAREYLDKALALNPDLGEARASLGRWLRNEFRWEEASIEFRKALELTPSNALTHARFAGLLWRTGKLGEALNEARKAHELDPLQPVMAFTIGQVLYERREFDQAIEQYKHVLLIAPDYYEVLLWMAFAYVCKSMPDEALRFVLKWQELVRELPGSPGFTKSMVALFQARAGLVEESRVTFNEATSKEPGLSPVLFALWHIALGNIDLAFEYLDKAYQLKDEYLFDIKVDPWYDPLRSDPRFKTLLQKLHLA